MIKQIITDLTNIKYFFFGQILATMLMYFRLHYPIYDILIGIITTTLIFLLLQVVFKSEKNN